MKVLGDYQIDHNLIIQLTNTNFRFEPAKSVNHSLLTFYHLSKLEGHFLNRFKEI
jgi:hypothetical protein